MFLTCHVLPLATESLACLRLDLAFPEAHSEPCQTSKIECFAKRSILDVWQDSECVFDFIPRFGFLSGD